MHNHERLIARFPLVVRSRVSRIWETKASAGIYIRQRWLTRAQRKHRDLFIRLCDITVIYHCARGRREEEASERKRKGMV